MFDIRNKRIIIIVFAIITLFGTLYFNEIAIGAPTTNPEINYAYIDEGVVKINITDSGDLASKPIVYRIGKEARTYEIDWKDYIYEYDEDSKRVGRVYEIYVEIPSEIFITIINSTGNESTYKFSIKEDNAALTNYIPEFIMDRLSRNRQSTVNRFKGFEDILELEYGKVVDAFSLYDNIIRDSYYKYNKADINFKASGLSIDKDGNIKLNKYGIFKITMTHKLDKTFEEATYVLIKPNWRNTEKRNMPSNFNPYIVYKDKIKVADYFKYEDDGSSKKSKVDTTYMLVYNEETEKTCSMNDQISLELNKTYKLSVLNFEDNSQHDFYIMRQEKEKTINKTFTDLKTGHWASKDINALVSKGILSGYPDGKFKPGGNITVKEFMTILSRKIAEEPNKVKPIIGDVMIPISPNTWGYIESKSILDRISLSALRRFDYVDMDRAINRGEVAFLINNVFILDTPYKANEDKFFTDSIIAYRPDIRKLVDLGIISGYPDGTFKPKNKITRAEIASLITRIK